MKTSAEDSCVWCDCAAVPSGCYDPVLAKRLPAAVFKCHFGNDAENEDNDKATEKALEFTGKELLGQMHAPLAAHGFNEEQTVLGKILGFFLSKLWAILNLEEEAETAPVFKWRTDPPVHEAVAHTVFQSWQDNHGKEYATKYEAAHRFAIFKETVKEIFEHNQRPGISYKLGVNQFSDLSWEEFSALRLMSGQNCSATHTNKKQLHQTRLPVDLPRSVDWRKQGAVSPVKDQGHCGSCWTFSTTGCLESHHFLKTGEMVLLSEQQLVDCAELFDNHGCNGGLPSHAFEYIRYAGGLDSETGYPYSGVGGKCQFSENLIAAQDLGSYNITFQDEAELHVAVAKAGPVSIAFQVASDFKSYAGGVYDSTVCKSGAMDVNHAVLAVGYDTDEEGGDYWIVKNSWGTKWGEEGYFKMARGKNMCGVADCASYPLV